MLFERNYPVAGALVRAERWYEILKAEREEVLEFNRGVQRAVEEAPPDDSVPEVMGRASRKGALRCRKNC